MQGQMDLFDWMPSLQPEPEVGEYMDRTGANICHIMRPNYIGKKVLIDVSTQSHKWYLCGILERYFERDGHMRSVVYTGKKQRSLIDHVNGRTLYECKPWDFERVMKCKTK